MLMCGDKTLPDKMNANVKLEHLISASLIHYSAETYVFLAQPFNHHFFCGTRPITHLDADSSTPAPENDWFRTCKYLPGVFACTLV